MGIPRGAARLLLAEHRRCAFFGRLLQLGRSTIYFTQRELELWARKQEVALRPPHRPALSHDPRLAEQGCIDDRTFFSQVGFDVVQSCDVSGWEGADYIFDFNRPVPAELVGRFDAVLDHGLLAQLFHLPQALANLHALLRVGGRVVHAAVPSNNHMDLGFFMISPSFFHDYYLANGYGIDASYFCETFPYWHRSRLYSAPWKVYRYEPGCLDHLNYGRYGGKQAAIFLVATRRSDSTCDTIPQASHCVRHWAAYEAAGPAGIAGAENHPDPGSLGARLERIAERLFAASPLLSRLYRPLKRVKEKILRTLPRRMPPRVGRY